MKRGTVLDANRRRGTWQGAVLRERLRRPMLLLLDWHWPEKMMTFSKIHACRENEEIGNKIILQMDVELEERYMMLHANWLSLECEPM